MRYYDYNKKRPKEGQWCIIKERLPHGIHIEMYPQPYYAHWGFRNHPKVVSWAPKPKHICEDPKGWKSEFRGDELPAKSCWCLVCTDKDRFVSHAYFDMSEQRFLGNPDVVAYMPF